MTQENPSMNFRQFDRASRFAALAEAHARPPVEFGPAKFVRHFAFQADQETCQTLLADLGVAGADTQLRLAQGTVGKLSVKLERHTEFYTCTVFEKSGKKTDPVASAAELLQTDDFVLLSDITISIHDNQSSLIKALPLGERQLGGIMRGGLEVRTTLKPDADGRQYFSVVAGGMSSHETGRRVQRLLELETYRILTLLGLETARSCSPQLCQLEDKVDALVSVKWAEAEDEDSLHAQLNQLSEVSAKLNSMRAMTRFRFSASQAYYDLVVQRLQSLEETKTGDIQTLTGFIRSRLDPAISTIRSVDQRCKRLSQEIDSALSLLRTRIDVELSRSNQQSLISMNRRHSQQLLIAQTVEGLSVVAISYYAVGLLSYLAKAFKEQGLLPMTVTAATAICVPVVVGIVWLSMRRLRRHWEAN